MEFGLRTIGMNGRRRMESNWSDDSYSLSVFNERRVYPVEWTSIFHDSTLECLDSLHRIPNDMFCSLRFYLIFTSWPAFMELLVYNPYGILLHLLSPNDLDRNPLSRSTIHVALSVTVCLLLSCIPIPVWWPGPSCLWFLSQCWSPTCRIACWVPHLHTCCLILLLLLVLESILFLNSLEVEWCV